jgi:hypothetical protein
MMACIILHNMIVEDEKDDADEDLDLNEPASTTYEDLDLNEPASTTYVQPPSFWIYSIHTIISMHV